MEMLTFKHIDFISNILYYQWEDFMFQGLISVHMHTPKCAIPEKIQFYFVFKFHMLFLWYPWKFHFPILFGFFLEYPICHFTLGNFRENKTSSLDIPHSCVAHFGNSKAKYQDRWNFHMIFLDHCSKFHFFFNWPVEFQPALSLIHLDILYPQTPPPGFSCSPPHHQPKISSFPPTWKNSLQ